MPNQTPKPQWAISFGINDVTWNTLCQAAEQKYWSALALALESNLVSETHLLDWQRKNTQLQTLKHDFFNGPPPLELFHKYDFLECQRSGSMPITDWNGQIYWAKLSTEPSPFEVDGSKTQWFLAPWSGMKKWFVIWEKEKKGVATHPTSLPPGFSDAVMHPITSTPPPPPLPRQIPLPVPQAAKILPQPAVQSAVQPVFKTSISYKPPAPETNDDLANVFEFGDSEIQLNPSFTGTEVKGFGEIPLEAIPPADPSHELELPSETLQPAQNTFIESKVETIVLESQIPPIPEDAKSSPVLELAPLSQPSPQSATASMDFSSLFQDPVPQSEHVAEILHPVPAPVQTNSILTITPDLFEKKLRAAHDQDGVAEVLMGMWQNYFEQIMILLFQQDRLIMWWSNGKFSSTFKRGETVSLDKPSVFKIVSTTSHPYHGQVMTSPENDHFFQVVNGGKYPEHLTLVPVLAGERVVAMILGTTTFENGKKITLPKLEDDAKVFATTLFKVMTPARQAS